MKAILLQATLNPLDIMYTTARTCYSKFEIEELWDKCKGTEKEKKQELVLRVLNSGHMSIAEHVFLTFGLDGMSRACSHQLVRHRHATYSQKSQRYVKTKDAFLYNTPETILKHKWPAEHSHWASLQEVFEEHMKDVQKKYEWFVEAGIPEEDARYVLPNACQTNIAESLNLREFIHVCNERLCVRAQDEIRDLVKLMRQVVLEHDEYKFLTKFLVPKCSTCTEHEKCTNKN